MSGYMYGEGEPVEECGCCGGEARAEFCDIGVGMQQVSPYHCIECGAAESIPDGKGGWIHGWRLPMKPSELGQSVTGYIINGRGAVWETTFDEDHRRFYERLGTSFSELRAKGWVRITNLEGFAIDLPPFMTRQARSALAKVLKEIAGETATVDGGRRDWGLPYVMEAGARHGREMRVSELMAVVSRLPDAPEEAAVSTLSVN